MKQGKPSPEHCTSDIVNNMACSEHADFQTFPWKGHALFAVPADPISPHVE
jgi:hypothetical protein